MAHFNKLSGRREEELGPFAKVLQSRLLLLVFAIAPNLTQAVCAQTAETSVYTHHYDVGRTGWDQTESQLTQQSVGSGQFAALATTIPLDDQVNGQPLISPNQTITGRNGSYGVVYVATESNTVYGIDSTSGKILIQKNFGQPVPIPLTCNNGGPNIGIDSTPVINPDNGTLNFIAYTLVNGVPTYLLHSVYLNSLQDAVPPVTVSASHTTSNGTVNFSAAYQRQRPALLYNNGNLYAGFGSFCDFGTSISRGWLLGWGAAKLTPLTSNQLNDTLSTSPNNWFLSSIWMSGAGPAADASGDVYFTTGNSDPSGTTYDGLQNIEESIVKVPPTLTGIWSSFTPNNAGALDADDGDIGSGGVLVIPASAGYSPPLAAAAGKDGRMFLMNANSLGGFTAGGPDNVLATVNIGECWCTLSFFMGSDGVGRIVSSGANNVITWKILQSPSSTTLVQEASGQVPATVLQDGGFFTSVSSNGTTAGTGVIWAVGRPRLATGAGNNMPLYAFSTTPANGALPVLATLNAGYWPNAGNSNVVPVVANGRVFVASANQLMIFGLNPVSATALPDVVATTVAYDPVKGLFSTNVLNQGKGATPTGVTVGVSYLVDGKIVSCGWSSQALNPGASVQIGAQCGPYTMPPGEHSISAFVDDVNRFAESDKTNNVFSLAYPAATLPDLTPTGVFYYPGSGVFTSVIKNAGQTTPNNVVVGVGYLVDGKKASCGWEYDPIAPGASVTIGSQCNTFSIPTTGVHTVSAVADDAKRITMSTRANSTLTEAYSYPLDDLVPTKLSYDVATGLFSSIVANKGVGATPAGITVGVAYYVDSQKVSCGWISTPIAAGGSATIGAGCGAFAIPSGTHVISVLADDVNRMMESDKSNNILTQTITISPPTGASSSTLNAPSRAGRVARSTAVAEPPPTATPGLVAKSLEKSAASPNVFTGTLVKAEGFNLTFKSRTGDAVKVNDQEAVRSGRVSVLVLGRPYSSLGRYDQDGSLVATTVERAKNGPESWPADQ